MNPPGQVAHNEIAKKCCSIHIFLFCCAFRWNSIVFCKWSKYWITFTVTFSWFCRVEEISIYAICDRVQLMITRPVYSPISFVRIYEWDNGNSTSSHAQYHIHHHIHILVGRSQFDSFIFSFVVRNSSNAKTSANVTQWLCIEQWTRTRVLLLQIIINYYSWERTKQPVNDAYRRTNYCVWCRCRSTCCKDEYR